MSRSPASISARLFRSDYICQSCRANPLPPRTPGSFLQKRWIGMNHIRRIKEAQDHWAAQAEDVMQGKKQSMLSLLEERGYVNQIVGQRDELDATMTHRRVGAYVGVDPTAPSLHIGHMVPLMALGWLYINGYQVTFLLGGTTARFGDPTDRLMARDKVKSSTRKANIAAMHLQLKRLGASIERYAERRGYAHEWAWKRALVNNNTWWNKVSVSEFLSVLGSGTRIGPMLGRDTVKNRMRHGDGMSFADFTYPLLQAWDWWELYQHGTQIQIGGADQFGNILAGAEAVKHLAKHDPKYEQRKKIGVRSHPNHVISAVGTETSSQNASVQETESRNFINDPMGFTVPLLTTSAGEKFGKSAGNAIWLDEQMTSTFDLYQFFLRSADADVERYLKLFTFLPMTTIQQLMAEHAKDESKRIAQHKLAHEFVELVCGVGAAQKAEEQHRTLFGKSLSTKDIRAASSTPSTSLAATNDTNLHNTNTDINPILNKRAPQTNIANMGAVQITLPWSLVRNQPMSKILWHAGLVSSRGEGQRLINAGGAHIGGRSDESGPMGDDLTFAPIRSGNRTETKRYIIDDDLLVLRVGKWKMKVIKLVSDDEFRESGGSCPGWGEADAQLA